MKIILIDYKEFPYQDALAKEHELTIIHDLTIHTLNQFLQIISESDIILISHAYVARNPELIETIKELRDYSIKSNKVAPFIVYSEVRRLNSDHAILQGADSYIIIDEPKYLNETLNGYARAKNNDDYGHFSFRTMDESRKVTELVSDHCPNPMKASLGISEILLNAVEHGNLSLHSEEKTILLHNNFWLEEVDRRIRLEGNQEKFVDITFEKVGDEILITVIDKGEGFDWQGLELDQVEKTTHQSGRGIGIATQLSFKELKYIGNGNKVIGIISLK